jgi:hypothetical protein
VASVERSILFNPDARSDLKQKRTLAGKPGAPTYLPGFLFAWWPACQPNRRLPRAADRIAVSCPVRGFEEAAAMSISLSQLIVWLIIGGLAGSLAGMAVTAKWEGLGRWTSRRRLGRRLDRRRDLPALRHRPGTRGNFRVASGCSRGLRRLAHLSGHSLGCPIAWLSALCPPYPRTPNLPYHPVTSSVEGRFREARV